MASVLERASWCLMIVLAAPCAAAHVLTVGGTNPAFPDIPSAINAAVEGDVILVRAGVYGGFTIDGVPLSVIADTGAAVTITSPVAVRNIPADRSVVLAGLSIPGPFGSSALLLENDAGHVRLESLQVSAGQFLFAFDWFAVEVLQCADVSLVDCTLVGRHGELSGMSSHGGEAALHADGSAVSLLECSATGGAGNPGTVVQGLPIPGSVGASAAVGIDTFLFARDSHLTGGAGGNGHSGGAPPPGCTTPFNYPTPGGDGGPGLTMSGALSSGSLIATTASGGAGGTGGVDPCGNQMANGATGTPTVSAPGVVTKKPGPALSFSVPQPAREGQNVQLHVEGPPGSSALLLLAARAGFTNLPALQGVLLVQPPVRRVLLGTIPAAGFLDATMPVPADLGPGVEALQVHAQAVFIVNGRTLLASPGVIVMLDAAF